MHFRRGHDPVLYHLLHEELDIGTLTRLGDGSIVFSLHGFHSSTVAASAAWAAHQGRLAYEAQFADAAADGGLNPARFLAAHSRLDGADVVRKLDARHEGATIRLSLDGEEIGRLTEEPAAGGLAPLWSIALPLGPADTPAVFALAAARRMWEAVRRSGLWRRMAQWIAPPPLTPVA
jgi:hypothetical protein